MQSRQAKLIETLDRVDDFLEKNAGALSEAVTATVRRNFAATHQRLVEHMKTQDAEARDTHSRVAIQYTLRSQLIRKHMRPIAVVARAQLSTVPELCALTVPPGNQQFTALVAAGYGMARAATLHEAIFLAAGLPDGFIERLVQATEALQAGVTARGQANALRVGATAGLWKEARVARGHLRVLDTLIRAALDDDDALLAQWKSLRHIAAVPVSRAVPEPDASSAAGAEETAAMMTVAAPRPVTFFAGVLRLLLQRGARGRFIPRHRVGYPLHDALNKTVLFLDKPAARPGATAA